MYKVDIIKINNEEYHLRKSRSSKRVILSNVSSNKSSIARNVKYFEKYFLVKDISLLITGTMYFRNFDEYKAHLNERNKFVSL